MSSAAVNKHKAALKQHINTSLVPEVQQVNELLQDAVELLSVDVVLNDPHSLEERERRRGRERERERER